MTEGRAEVIDSGKVHWSRTPTNEPPTEPTELVVRIRVTEMSEKALEATKDLIAWAKPAHVQHRIEMIN
jgi:hypothetical protein